MERRVLETALIVERDAIKIDGVEYEIRGPDDMTIRLSTRLNQLTTTLDSASVNADQLIEILKIIFIDPPSDEVLLDRPISEVMRWIGFFSERSHLRAEAGREPADPPPLEAADPSPIPSD